MALKERPWHQPIYIYPLSKRDPLYGFGFRHEVLYPDGKRGVAEEVEGARKLAREWEKEWERNHAA